MTPEERKSELEAEIAVLTKTAFEESSKVLTARSELKELEADKEAFLKRRREEELLLLADVTAELEKTKGQLELFRKLKSKEEAELERKRVTLREEQSNLHISKEEIKKQKAEALRLLTDVRETLSLASIKLFEAEGRETETKKALESAKATREDNERKRDKLKERDEEHKITFNKNAARTTELSAWEKDLKSRERQVAQDLQEATKLNEETKELVLWHKYKK